MGSFAFPRSHHIKKPSEFRTVLDHGAKRHSRFFVFFRLATDRDVPRLGVSVSRKIGNAVVRNRVKRLIREAFRLNRETANLRGSDLIVIAKRGAGEMSFPAVEREFTDIVTPWRMK